MESGYVGVRDMRIEPECQELAIIVQYTVEEEEEKSPMRDNGKVNKMKETVTRRREKKKIKLRKSLSTTSDVGKVAMEVMKKCPYIHDSKFDSLKLAIRKLQHELIRGELMATAQDLRETVEDDNEGKEFDESKEVDMEKLRDYIELLYEGADQNDMRHKIIGTSKILNLCSDVRNLEVLIRDQTLMGALTRVIREEFKKSMELNYNIMRCFLAFSNFSDMHPILIKYKVLHLHERASKNMTLSVSINSTRLSLLY